MVCVGVVMDPIRGAKDEGIKGFGKGLFTGVIGVVTKPVSGALSLVSETAQGIGNTADFLLEEDPIALEALEPTENVNSYFGKNLEDVMELQRVNLPDSQTRVPVIVPKVTNCLINLGGLEEKGIFRISATKAELEVARDEIDNNQSLSTTNPHVPAALLKLWLRSLVEPLIPQDMYAQSLGCVRGTVTEEGLANDIGWIYNALPEINQLIMIELSRLVTQVDAKQKINHMPLSNIAIILSQCILRDAFASSSDLLENHRFETAFTQAWFTVLPTIIPKLKLPEVEETF